MGSRALGRRAGQAPGALRNQNAPFSSAARMDHAVTRVAKTAEPVMALDATCASHSLENMRWCSFFRPEGARVGPWLSRGPAVPRARYSLWLLVSNSACLKALAFGAGRHLAPLEMGRGTMGFSLAWAQSKHA